ncbi:ras gtpase [Anaeramoeba ignava]|uniref:small monomeric GTPase n=1 Tax=Anaeramoeba ignava TaxID=1746090 RepID=A0A9Q0LEG4_ANAIG|nr:ras gtpase [Anaeramoeba ignava]
MDNDLEIRIGLFGFKGVGKSSMIMRFLMNEFVEEIEMGMGNRFRRKFDLDDESIYIYILDTTSDDSEFIFNNSIEYCDRIILVYSITDRLSFNQIKIIYQKITDYSKEEKKYPKILIGNKSDLFTKRQITCKEGKELARELNCKYIETSAKTGENINQIFYESLLLEFEELKKNQNQNQNNQNQNNQNQNNQNQNNQNQNQNQNNQNQKKKGKCLLM